MKYFLGFNRLQYFPLWIIVGYYLPQSILGFFEYETDYVLKFLIITLVSCGSYIFFYKYIYRTKQIHKIVNRSSRWLIDVSKVTYFVFGFYFVLVAYSATTAEQIALFEVFKGVGITDLAKSREMFLRTREGWEVIIQYVNAVFIMALIPYCIASLFYIRHKFRFHFLTFFLLCLALTLEKSVAVMAFIPIIVLNVNSTTGKNSFHWILVLVLFISATSFLARGGLQGEANLNSGSESAASMPESYQLVKCDGQICYLMNRIAWIPYATAIDWLKYQDVELNGGYALGQSIGLIAAAVGVQKTNLEREVFAFQWGQNETETGSSNTVYFIDAFVNFSWLGVILYAAIVALIVKILAVSDNVPIKCTAYVSLFYLGVNSLPPMLFSGGLIVIVIIALLFKQRLQN